jgi:hypothetical protein
MVDFLSALLPACPAIPIDGCVADFLNDLPSSGFGDGFREGLDKMIADLNKEIARLDVLSLSLQSGITALNNKIASLTAELEPYDNALAAIADSQSRTACPQLDTFTVILQALREFIAAQIAAINVAGLQTLLDAATANIGSLTCYIDLAQSLLDSIP